MAVVLFDADGVLFDACELHRQSLDKALIECGYNAITAEDHEKYFNGLPTKTKLNLLPEFYGIKISLETGKRIEYLKQKYTLELIATCIKPSDRLTKVMQYLKNKNCKTAICSNAKAISLHKMASEAGIKGYFDLILGNEMVENPKPSPDIYALACTLLKVKAKDCIVIEDTEKGLKAAQAAGIGKIILINGPDDLTLDLIEKYV